MSVCEICGDRGYSKYLLNCVQCQDAAVHRYCIVAPAMFDDKEFKWSCEDCVPRKSQLVSPCKKSGRLRSTVERLAIRKKARKNWRNNICSPQSKNLGKETAKPATSPSNIDQNIKELNSNNGIKTEGHGATGLDKSLCEVREKKLFDEMHVKENISRHADWADHAVLANKKSGVEEKTADIVHDQHAAEKSNRDDCKRPRKKRRVVIDMEYSDEDPDFVGAEQPHVVGDVGKDRSSKSNSEAFSELSNDDLPQLFSAESFPRPYPMKGVDHELTRDPPVLFASPVLAPPSPVKLANQIPTQPLFDVAWRGYCSIRDNETPMSLVLVAQLSNKAHEKVQAVVHTLPELLNFDFVPKQHARPNKHLTSNDIGLYFFPDDERNEKFYEDLVEKMIDYDLVLKSHINNLELLVFCSRELPQEEWSFRRKNYLWGVFKPRKDPVIPNKPSNYNQKNLGTTRTISSSSSPHEDVGLTDELTQPISSNPLQRPHDNQGYKYNHTNRDVSNREACDYAERNQNDREHRRGNKRAPKWKDMCRILIQAIQINRTGC